MKFRESLKIISVALMAMATSAFALQKLPVQSVYSIGSAGDHLENQAGNNYNPRNMVDGNVKTAWALPYHSGEVILQFNLKNVATNLERIVINNGYGKSEKRFKQNSRAKKIGIYIDGTEKKNLVREWELVDVMEPQQVLLTDVKNVNSVYIRIHSVYPGTTWPDLCISEVSLEGTSSKVAATVTEPEDWEQNLAGRLDFVPSQTMALTPAQVEEMSRNHHVTLTDAQKKKLHKDWDLDRLGIIPSNWYDCSCGMYSVSWSHKDSIFIPAIQMSTPGSSAEENDGPDMVYGPYSRGLIMGIDGLLYENGAPVDLQNLVKKQKSENKKIVYNRSYDCVESGYSIDFPPVEIVDEKQLKKFKKNLIKAGLKFCEMADE